jgi:glycosyltransferase involved in cell wall biosynthesis
MDSQHPVFPHQIAIVKDLSRTWDWVYVITCEENCVETKQLPGNVFVYNLKWSESYHLTSVAKLLVFFLHLCITQRNLVVFSYMTESLSAIIAPITRFMKIWHVLWYAHTSHPKRLSWCHFWVDRIVTSTQDSIPLTSIKIIPIGQAVDQDAFECAKRKLCKKGHGVQLIHVGRLDPSKNITTLIRVFDEKFAHDGAILHLVGSPTVGNEQYLKDIASEINDRGLESRIILHGQQNQQRIKELLCQSDIFLHAFMGSLDKSLVEALFSKLFVISCNINFVKEFGSFTGAVQDNDIAKFLSRELDEYKSRHISELQSIIDTRYYSALHKHSRSQWLTRLEGVLRHESI